MAQVRYSLLKNTPPSMKIIQGLLKWKGLLQIRPLNFFGEVIIEPPIPSVPTALRRKKNGLSIVERNAFVGKFSLMFLYPPSAFSQDTLIQMYKFCSI